jgi:hypothetical protein
MNVVLAVLLGVVSVTVCVPPGPPVNTTTSFPSSLSTTTSFPSSSSTTWRPLPPTEPSEKIVCNSYRDISADFPVHGDMVCKSSDFNYFYSRTKKQYIEYELLVRDTIVSTPSMNKERFYHKELDHVYIFKVNILNFGETHGFARQVTIQNKQHKGNVWVKIDLPPKEEVKLFVEVYGRKL